LWNLKILKKTIKGKKMWLFFAMCSLCTTWGLDALDKAFGLDSYSGVFQVAFGSWLVFVFATTAKTCAINKYSIKEYSKVYGGELLSFLLMSFGIFLIT
jgi:hypothetical protein